MNITEFIEKYEDLITNLESTKDILGICEKSHNITLTIAGAYQHALRCVSFDLNEAPNVEELELPAPEKPQPMPVGLLSFDWIEELLEKWRNEIKTLRDSRAVTVDRENQERFSCAINALGGCVHELTFALLAHKWQGQPPPPQDDIPDFPNKVETLDDLIKAWSARA